MDGHTYNLVAAWVQLWDELTVEFSLGVEQLIAEATDGRVSKAKVVQSERLANALQLTQERLNGLADGVELTVAEDLPAIVRDVAGSQVAMMQSQLPAGVARTQIAFNTVSAEAVHAMVKRSLEQIHKATRPLADDVVKVMKRELILGITVGDNPKRTASRIVRSTEQRLNGGLTRAMMIDQTEVLDASRAATQAADKANADVMRGWVWGAELGARTCPSCLVNHVTEHPIEEPGPIDHHNGRYTRIPLTKTWAELGFTGIEEPPSLIQDSRMWFDGLTPDTQKTIMGPERLRLLQAGEIQWSDLTTRTRNDGWRDSMTVTPLKNLR